MTNTLHTILIPGDVVTFPNLGTTMTGTLTLVTADYVVVDVAGVAYGADPSTLVAGS